MIRVPTFPMAIRVPSILVLVGTVLMMPGCSGSAEEKNVAIPPAASEVTGEPTAKTAAPVEPSQPAVSATTAVKGWFTEVTKQAGLPAQQPWPDGLYLTPEITPGGVGLFDYDGDGDLDIYQVRHGEPREMPKSFKDPAPNRLYRQDADGRFTQVEDAAGLADPGYGHGCAMGDIDNDGDVDVLVTNYGPNKLYRNDGGAFVDISDEAGIGGDSWSSASAFVDYDRDGDLDLFVVNFGVFDATRRCGDSGAAGVGQSHDYCGPHLFEGVRDRLYRNDGGGRFTDVSESAGINAPARGWGVIAADLTGDGWPDLYVCNDEEPNQLWVNDGKGGFYDEAMLMGAALNGAGRVEASMGVTVGDVNSDGRFDLFMTHVASETNTLYTLGEGDFFSDDSSASGMAGVDLPYTGWGCGLLDMDHDGDLDLAVGNGRVAVGPVLATAQLGPYWSRYAEPNLLFRNEGEGRFRDLSDQAGGFTAKPGLTRGLAFGDLDQDGDIDLVSNGIDNHLAIFRNDAPKAGAHWLQARVLTAGRDALGAKVELLSAGMTQVRYVLRSYSYLASNDPRVHFGLGDESSPEAFRVTWPDGAVEAFEVERVDQTVILRQGEGSSDHAE
ncbi:ASPIC and UnbV [Planctomycetes bacterium MalM25]|nr:ASPIC and UnbV [Planctomycetes bacterium MalM25]